MKNVVLKKRFINDEILFDFDNQMNQEEIFALATNMEIDWGDRYNAILKLEDQKYLKEIATIADDPDIRNIAVMKIEDEDTLIDIVLNDQDNNVRKTALDKLPSWNRQIFKQIAEHDDYWVMRKEAVERLPPIYDEFFANIVMHDKDYRIRKAAMRKMNMHNINKDTLLELVLHAEDGEMRVAASRLIDDPKMLCKIATESADYVIAEEAIEKITSEDCLKKIAENAEYAHTRMFVIKRIDDQEFLRSLVQKDNSMLVRGTAIHSITSLEVLEEIKMLNNIDLQKDVEERIRIISS